MPSQDPAGGLSSAATCDTQEEGQQLQLLSRSFIEAPVHATEFELVVHSNVVRPSHPQHGLQKILITNDSPLFIEAHFMLAPPASVVNVMLQYVVVCKASDAACCGDVWVQRQLGVLTWPELQMELPGKQLASSYHAIAPIKKLKNSRASCTFHTYFRAEVSYLAAEGPQTFEVYSPEVFVCGNRNFRRRSNMQQCSI